MFNTPLDCDWPMRLDSWANVLLAVKKTMPWIMRVKDTWHASSLKYKNLVSFFFFVLTLNRINEWRNKESICIFLSVWCSKNTIQVFKIYSWDLSIFCIFFITFFLFKPKSIIKFWFQLQCFFLMLILEACTKKKKNGMVPALNQQIGMQTQSFTQPWHYVMQCFRGRHDSELEWPRSHFPLP